MINDKFQWTILHGKRKTFPKDKTYFRKKSVFEIIETGNGYYMEFVLYGDTVNSDDYHLDKTNRFTKTLFHITLHPNCSDDHKVLKDLYTKCLTGVPGIYATSEMYYKYIIKPTISGNSEYSTLLEELPLYFKFYKDKSNDK